MNEVHVDRHTIALSWPLAATLVVGLVAMPVGALAWLDARIGERIEPLAAQIERLRTLPSREEFDEVRRQLIDVRIDAIRIGDKLDATLQSSP
jgi:hypothetical protein